MSQYDPLDTRGQEVDKAEEQERRRLAREREEKDFKWLMASRQGRRIVWRLMSDAGVFTSSFTENSMRTAFNEGKRNEGLRLLNKVHELCPELYPVMQKEATNVTRNDD